MIKMENHLGVISVSHEYFVALVSRAASHCFGVVGMANRNATQSLFSLMQREPEDKGVRVRLQNGNLIIDLHILVMYGVNISAITNSIMSKVRYTVEEATGFNVARVNVFVDGMKAE